MKFHLNDNPNKTTPISVSSSYSRVHHFDLVLNQTILNQQQHKIRCSLVYSF